MKSIESAGRITDILSLSLIPDEIWKRIMSFSGPKSTLWQWARISRHFQYLAKDPQLWKDFCQTHPLFKASFTVEDVDYQEMYKHMTFASNLRTSHFKIASAISPANSLLLGQIDHHFVFLLSDRKIAFIEPMSHTIIKTLEAHSQEQLTASIVSIAHTSNYFAVSYSDGLIEIWETHRWTQVSKFNLPNSYRKSQKIEIVILDNRLYCLTYQHYYTWHIKEKVLSYLYFSKSTVVMENIPSSSNTHSILFPHWFSSQAKLNEYTLILSDREGRIYLWDIQKNDLKVVYHSHKSIIELDCNHAWKHIVFFTGRKIYFFNYHKNDLICTINLKHDYFNSISWQKEYAFVTTSNGCIFQVSLLEENTCNLILNCKKTILSQAWYDAKLYFSMGEGIVQLIDFGIP